MEKVCPLNALMRRSDVNLAIYVVHADCMPQPNHHKLSIPHPASGIWALFLIRLPQTIRSRAIFPHFDGPILASRRVELPIGREADAPDRTVMTFVYI